MRKRKNPSIFDSYMASGDEKRIRIILDHYYNFIPVVNAYEFGLVNTIRAERVYNRRTAIGDLGVRVQTSGISNPTASEGDEKTEIQKAVRSGDYITALRGADCYESHKNEILTLQDMRDTYAIVEQEIGSLDDENELFKRYLHHEFDLTTIADSEGVTVDAIKQRFRKARNNVIDNTLFWMARRKPYYYMDEKGA